MKRKIIWDKGYNDIIKSMLGVSESEAQEIQDIMRAEVFHSTLDWQDRKEWAAGCKKAYKIWLDWRKTEREEDEEGI